MPYKIQYRAFDAQGQEWTGDIYVDDPPLDEEAKELVRSDVMNKGGYGPQKEVEVRYWGETWVERKPSIHDSWAIGAGNDEFGGF